MRTILIAAALVLATTVARADGTWTCSVIEEGKPRVLKVRTAKGKAVVSDWKSRIIQKFMDGSGETPATLVQDDEDALIVTVEPFVTRSPGKIRDVGVSVIAIDKKGESVSYTNVSTAYLPIEMKGTCTQ